MAFTNAERVAIRKFCGYGVKTTAGLFGSMFGTMEFILDKMDSDEESEIRTNYLAVLPDLEAAILLAGDTLDTDQAAVWTRNKNELADRKGLFDDRRKALCATLGIEPGPGLSSGRIVRG